MRQISKSAESQYWGTLLEAELATAQGHPKSATDLLSPLYKRNPAAVALGTLYRAALDKIGKDQEAERIRAKLDDVQSKTSYLSSVETMQSPVGPLALANP